MAYNGAGVNAKIDWLDMAGRRPEAGSCETASAPDASFVDSCPTSERPRERDVVELKNQDVPALAITACNNGMLLTT